MNTHYSILPVVICLCFTLLAGCQKEQYMIANQDGYQTKTFLDNKKDINDRYTISANDVSSYVKLRLINGDNNLQIKEIIPLSVDKTQATIYVVNLDQNKGWYIFAGDARIQPVLAMNDSGNFPKGDYSEYGKEWIGDLNYIISNISDNLNTDCDSTSVYVQEWKAIRSISKLLSQGNVKTDPDTTDTTIEVYYDTLINTLLGPFSETRWIQYHPYNVKVPYIDNGENRCLAGCVPIAIAQFLYYTHYKNGIPTSMYETGSCSDLYSNGPPYYGFSFGNWSSNAWSKMSKTTLEYLINPLVSTDNVAVLVAYMAKGLGTSYANDGSGTTSLDSIPHVLSNMGIYNSQVQNYNASVVVANLNSNRIVITSGKTTTTAQYGHAYIIDGYKRLRIRVSEIITHSDGEIETNISYIDNSYIHVNMGDQVSINGSFHTTQWVAHDFYFPADAKIVTNWTLTQ